MITYKDMEGRTQRTPIYCRYKISSLNKIWYNLKCVDGLCSHTRFKWSQRNKYGECTWEVGCSICVTIIPSLQGFMVVNCDCSSQNCISLQVWKRNIFRFWAEGQRVALLPHSNKVLGGLPLQRLHVFSMCLYGFPSGTQVTTTVQRRAGEAHWRL